MSQDEASRVRRAIVLCLAEGERSSGEIAKALNRHHPGISHHLAMLLNMGLVCVRKEGSRRIYSLAGEHSISAPRVVRFEVRVFFASTGTRVVPGSEPALVARSAAELESRAEECETLTTAERRTLRSIARRLRFLPPEASIQLDAIVNANAGIFKLVPRRELSSSEPIE